MKNFTKYLKLLTFVRQKRYNEFKEIQMKLKFKTQPILDYLEQNNLTKAKFAKKCNISVVTLEKILKGDPSFKGSAFLSIFNETGIKSCDIVEEE